MNDIAFNIAGWTITALLAIGAAGLFALNTWMRTLENGEGEDDDE